MTETTVRPDEIHIRFAAAQDAKCDQCNKKFDILHLITYNSQQMFLCDHHAQWFVNMKKQETKNNDNNSSV